MISVPDLNTEIRIVYCVKDRVSSTSCELTFVEDGSTHGLGDGCDKGVRDTVGRWTTRCRYT